VGAGVFEKESLRFVVRQPLWGGRKRREWHGVIP
jgi:hypothetical protein